MQTDTNPQKLKRYLSGNKKKIHAGKLKNDLTNKCKGKHEKGEQMKATDNSNMKKHRLKHTREGKQMRNR